MKAFAAIGFIAAWFAVTFQYYLLIKNNEGPLLTKTVQFFSYFTILTNSLAAIYFTVVLFSKAKNSWLLLPTTATAIAVYITLVGLVYNVVLRFTWNPQGFQKLVDELLHTFNPLFFILFWWLFVSKENLKWKNAFLWLLYPLFYFVYILLRGALTDAYPYPFIDVNAHGYAKVFFNSLVILLVFLFFSFLFIGIGRLKNKSSLK